jgi:HAD superfamily hydrolase (TIGR01549 family)
MAKPYLIFDAGGTLVFPDFKFLASAASEFNINTSPDQLFQIHCKLIFDLDIRTIEGKRLVDPFPNGYAEALFQPLVKEPETRRDLAKLVLKRDHEKSLWTTTHPWVEGSLTILKKSGYSMSVVSNSDGRASQILLDLNLRKHFDRVFDSEIIGFSKPDVRLFNHALNVLDLNPGEVIYIGDVYFIDVWGANQAGLGGIHMDPQNLYHSWPGVHIPTIEKLHGFLRKYSENPGVFDLHPAQNFNIRF